MDAFVRWQQLTTVTVGSAGGDVIQSRSKWLDTLCIGKVSIHVEIFLLAGKGAGASGMDFFIETSNSDEGPWTVLESWSGGASGMKVDEVLDLEAHYAAVSKLQRLVRWRVHNPAGEARKASFRLRYGMPGQQAAGPASYAAVASAEFVQDWVTVHFKNANTDLVQDQEEWIDCEGMDSLAFLLQIPVVSNVVFKGETAPALDGPWSTIGAEVPPFSGPDFEYAGSLFANRRPDAPQGYRLDRFVRWPLTGQAGGFICFRIRGVLRQK